MTFNHGVTGSNPVVRTTEITVSFKWKGMATLPLNHYLFMD